jgi:hypothetical protein
MTAEPRISPYPFVLGRACGAGAIACLVPAISVNLTAHLIKGEPWHAGAIYFVSVVVASVSGLVLIEAIKQRAHFLTFIGAVILTLAISFNLINALGSSRISRASVSEPREALRASLERLEEEASTLLKSLKHLPSEGALTPAGVVEAELAALEAEPIFARSKHCSDVTLPDSSALCRSRAATQARLARAQERDRLQARLAVINAELNTLGARPATIDPKVDAMSAVLAQLIPITPAARAFIGLSVDLHLAVFVELLAAFGPSLFRALFVFMIPAHGALPGQPSGELRLRGRAGRARNKAKPIGEADLPACVRTFISQRVIERADASIGATALHEAYKATCMPGAKPLGLPAFGQLMTRLYPKEPRGGRVFYTGITLAAGLPKLEVVR